MAANHNGEYGHMYNMVDYDQIRNKDPREREYLGMQRAVAMGAGRMVHVWVIEPIPFSELRGVTYEEARYPLGRENYGA